MSYSTLEVSRDGVVGWLVFDRPQAGNAINATMFVELEAAWRELEADDSIRVVVNTGNGGAFQTGLDVVQLASDKEALRASSRQTRDFELAMTGWHCGVTKPVIAAVNGTCAGGGLHFVADADIVLAADTATFLDPHVSVGQVSAFETIGLLKKAPMEAVTRMALVGRHERLGAERARQLGVVSEVIPLAELRARAAELARTIARHPAAELARRKAALWAVLETP
ncbi:MAG: enoyl-CoA hydratase/isomerase family protein [Acidimicrobiia bacterium]|nr:enoyl-CoA hydratase/isomerase family protein [Acidimicrobiia bacterium]MDH5237759.1 enoyl-CoA hydratase/isomerase family protein [Acidimicrobiia bacterium]